jgi:hypothetical protein
MIVFDFAASGKGCLFGPALDHFRRVGRALQEAWFNEQRYWRWRLDCQPAFDKGAKIAEIPFFI